MYLRLYFSTRQDHFFFFNLNTLSYCVIIVFKLNSFKPLQDPQCKVCRKTPVIRSSKHLFLDLPKV